MLWVGAVCSVYCIHLLLPVRYGLELCVGFTVYICCYLYALGWSCVYGLLYTSDVTCTLWVGAVRSVYCIHMLLPVRYGLELGVVFTVYICCYLYALGWSCV